MATRWVIERPMIFKGSIAQAHGRTGTFTPGFGCTIAEALLAAVPLVRPGRPHRRATVQGEIPSALNPPGGCPFHPRCPLAIDRCQVEVPPLRMVEDREVACHLADSRD